MGTTIKDLLAKNSAFPRKSLGQNFLTDKNILKKIIETADISPTDTILEIGPGTGILTQELAKRAKMVMAVEKDKKLAGILSYELKTMGIKNVEVVQKDILKLDNWAIGQLGKYKVVANLPYYITSPVIRKFLEIKKQPKLMVLMVQKEVAQRICSLPPDMNLLAVSVQFYAKPEIVKIVSKKCFWPEPKVNSAILRIAPLINADKNPPATLRKQSVAMRAGLINTDLFFKITKAGFSQPRKQLANNLSKGLKLNREKTEKWLQRNKIATTQRAETLTVEDWKSLTKTFGN